MNTLIIKLSRHDDKSINLRVHAAYCRYILCYYDDNRFNPLYEEECAKIIHLHDHKGYLVVTWSDVPTEEQKYRIKNAWDYCGEDGKSMTHLVRKVESIGDDSWDMSCCTDLN
jgi:hypothetical protein